MGIYKQDNSKRTRNVNLGLRMTRKEIDYIKELSKKAGLTQTELVLEALRRYETQL